MRLAKSSASVVGQNSNAASLGEDWCRLPNPRGGRLLGMARSTLMEMISRGEIKSTVIKKRGAVRGIRLIYLPALLETLHRMAEGGGGQ